MVDEVATWLSTSANPEASAAAHEWTPYMHLNGVSMYLENEGGALMLHTVVRSPPAAVFRHLMHLDDSGYQNLWAFQKIEVIGEPTVRELVRSWGLGECSL